MRSRRWRCLECGTILKTLKELRSKATFPLLLLTWGLQAVLMFAVLGLEIVSEKLEEWEALPLADVVPSSPVASDAPSLRRSARTTSAATAG